MYVGGARVGSCNYLRLRVLKMDPYNIWVFLLKMDPYNRWVFVLKMDPYNRWILGT